MQEQKWEDHLRDEYNNADERRWWHGPVRGELSQILNPAPQQRWSRPLTNLGRPGEARFGVKISHLLSATFRLRCLLNIKVVSWVGCSIHQSQEEFWAEVYIWESLEFRCYLNSWDWMRLSEESLEMKGNIIFSKILHTHLQKEYICQSVNLTYGWVVFWCLYDVTGWSHLSFFIRSMLLLKVPQRCPCPNSWNLCICYVT